METIGVTCIDPWFVLDDDPMIKDLYYFDKLIYKIDYPQGLENFCNALPKGKNKFKEKIQEIEKLEKAGLIYEYSDFQYKLDREKYGFEDDQATKYAIRAFELSSSFTSKDKPIKDVFIDFLERFREVGQLDTRICSIMLNKKEQNLYTPIIRNNYYNFAPSEQYSTNTVLSVVLKRFPTISRNIEIEKFIDFKKDPDTQLKLARLKDWILEISKKNYSEKEIEQKIDFLLLEYIKQLEIHKMKYNLGSIETFVTTTLGILENLVKLNFSKAAKVLFDLAKQDLTLLESEQKMIGKEVAYLHSLNEKNRL